MKEMKIVVLDPGHEKDTAGKRSPDGTLLEYEFNQTIANMTKEILSEVKDLKVILTKEMNYTSDLTTSAELKRRADVANNNKADIFISIHANAYEKESVSGFEVYHYPNNKSGKNLATNAHNYFYKPLKEKYGIKDRGIKNANFAVLRHAKMPAILLEVEFYTNNKGRDLLKSKDFREFCAYNLANMICKEFGFKLPDKKESYPEPDFTKGTDILGKSVLTEYQLSTFCKKVNPNMPSKLPKLYLELSEKLGIRGDIAFMQAIKETGYFKFGGDVKAEQHNYCGLGATGGGVKGASFKTEEDGVLAHLQHLYAYASKSALPKGMTKLDPRFDLVTRGTATVWERLGGKWAVPGYDSKSYSSFNEAYAKNATYGQQILTLYKDASKIENVVETPVITETTTFIELNIKDLPTVIIDGKSYVRTTDIAKVFGLTAIYNSDSGTIKITKEG